MFGGIIIMLYSTPKDLIVFIKQQLIAEDITITELANRLDKSQSSISMMFKRGTLTVAMLNDICNALGYDLEINLVKKDISANQKETYYNVALAARNETLHMNNEQMEAFAKSANNAPNSSRNRDMF